MNHVTETPPTSPFVSTSRRDLVVVLILICTAVPAWSTEGVDAVARVEVFERDFTRSAAPTRRRLLEALRDDLDGSTVHISGTVWSVSEADIERPTPHLPDRGERFFSWEYGGMIARADAQVGTPPPPIDRIRRRLADATVATVVIVRAGRRQVYALTADPELVDRLRPGGDVAVTVSITGMTDESLFGFLGDVHEPSTTLRCPNGREYSADTGYRYCPFCGAALAAEVPDTEAPTSAVQAE